MHDSSFDDSREDFMLLLRYYYVIILIVCAGAGVGYLNVIIRISYYHVW